MTLAFQSNKCEFHKYLLSTCYVPTSSSAFLGRQQ